MAQYPELKITGTCEAILPKYTKFGDDPQMAADKVGEIIRCRVAKSVYPVGKGASLIMKYPWIYVFLAFLTLPSQPSASARVAFK